MQRRNELYETIVINDNYCHYLIPYYIVATTLLHSLQLVRIAYHRALNDLIILNILINSYSLGEFIIGYDLRIAKSYQVIIKIRNTYHHIVLKIFKNIF
jgi:hypothetical protein